VNDNGEVNTQDSSLVQDNPRKRKRNGVNAKYNETIIVIEKQRAKFLEETIKNRPPENEDVFSEPFAHVNNIPADMKLRFRNRIHKVVDEFAYPPTSSTFQHCPLQCRRRIHPHLLLTVYHHQEFPRRLRIHIRTTSFASKCHPSGPHPKPSNTQ